MFELRVIHVVKREIVAARAPRAIQAHCALEDLARNARRAVTSVEMKKQDAPIRIKRVYDRRTPLTGHVFLWTGCGRAVCAK